ncbi:RbsD/FucU family protein [Mobilicoccus massiliensis]|uniref:RbsD/FucU family protein n=1 Tax=Mobilicoccus massiliensis TaxID=1522310 RepID=UPI00058DF3EA|nr:RbsD/FucU domain-containing protein [Mobilicoccus massiliensis]
MLRHIPRVLSPDLVKALMEMGEGDEIVLAEANLPAHSIHHQVIRADGVPMTTLLEAVLHLMPLDETAEEQVVLIEPEGGDRPAGWEKYTAVWGEGVEVELLPRPAFYENLVGTAVVVVTGETARDSSIILRKGALV